MTVQKFYNPHDLQSSVVLNVATGRERFKSRVLAAIESNLGSQQLQHILIHAPRGFGKSFLLRLVQIEVEQAYPDVAFVLLPEEQPNIDEPDALLREIRRIWHKEPADTVQARWHEAENQAWEEAVGALDQAMDQQFGKGKGLLIAAIENFDVMIAKVFKDKIAESSLREWLTRRSNRIMFLATASTGTIDTSYDARLFQAFEPIKLGPWDEIECLEYFNKHRKVIGRDELDERASAKARAIATFIGGTPRLAALLGEALLENDSIRSAELLDKVADDLTPYYKHQVDVLNPRSRKLLDALLRGGEPCSQTKLAERVGASSQAAIAQSFKALLDQQILIASKVKNSRETLYSVQDRVFAHFYRTRYLTHGQQPSSLEAIVEFLETYFSKDEKRSEASRLLNLNRPKEARLLADMAAREDVGPTPRPDILRRAVKRLRADARLLGIQDQQSLLDAMQELDDGKFEMAVLSTAKISHNSNAAAVSTLSSAISGWATYGLRLDDHARQTFDVTVKTAQKFESADEMVVAFRERGIYRSVALGDRAAAVEDSFAAHALTQRVTSDSLKVVALLCGSRGYSQTGRRRDALGTAYEAATIAARIGDVLQHARCERELAYLLTNHKRYNEGMVKAFEAAELASLAGDKGEQGECLRLAAQNLQHLKRHDEAITVAQKANSLAAVTGDISEQANSLGIVAQSLGRLGRYRDAIEVAKEAAALAAVAGEPVEQARFLRQAAWSYGYARAFAAQVNTARAARAISENGDDLVGQAKSLRIEAWGLMRLKRYGDAFIAAEKAASIGGNSRGGSEQGINLLLAAWILSRNKLHEEAIAKAQEAASVVSCDDNPSLESECWSSIAFNQRRLLRYDEAAKAATRAAELAASAGDIAEQIECLLSVIWNFTQLRRHTEMLTVARQATALAGSAAQPRLQALTLREVVRTASVLGDVDSATGAFKEWRAIEKGNEVGGKTPMAKSYLQHILVAGIRSMRTSPVIDFIISEKVWVSSILQDWQSVEAGYAIADILKEKGRVEAYGAIADLVNCMAAHIADEISTSTERRSEAVFYRLATATLNTIATSIRDVAFLRNVADLVQDALGNKFAPFSQVLRATAQFHESKGAVDALDRIDPDIASAIRRTYSDTQATTMAEV